MRKIEKTYTCHYSLIEMLVVVVLLSVLLIVTAKFVFQSNRRCTNVTKKVFLNQELCIMKDKWRNFIHGCKDELLYSEKDNSITSGSCRAVISNNKLLMITDGNKKSYKIPSYLNAKIHLVKSKEFADCAILEFYYKKRQRFPQGMNEIVRIAAVQTPQKGGSWTQTNGVKK